MSGLNLNQNRKEVINLRKLKVVKRSPVLAAFKILGYKRDSYENQRGAHVYWFKKSASAADFTTVGLFLAKHLDNSLRISNSESVFYCNG